MIIDGENIYVAAFDYEIHAGMKMSARALILTAWLSARVMDFVEKPEAFMLMLLAAEGHAETWRGTRGKRQ